MDYIYSNLNVNLIDTPNQIIWNSYETLPEPSAKYYMTAAVITSNYKDTVYLCIKGGSADYEWKKLLEGSNPEPPVQLTAPFVSISGSIISWTAVANAASYAIYKNGTFLTTITGTTFDLASRISIIGTYTIAVKAQSSDTRRYLDSDFSNTIIYNVSPRTSVYTGVITNTSEIQSFLTLPASTFVERGIAKSQTATSTSTTLSGTAFYFAMCEVGHEPQSGRLEGGLGTEYFTQNDIFGVPSAEKRWNCSPQSENHHADVSYDGRTFKIYAFYGSAWDNQTMILNFNEGE